MTKPMRWFLRLILLLLLLLAIAAFAGWWAVRGSLAQLDGEVSMPSLSAPVSVERDALGVVTIHAANEIDAARALGYVHGQERFFEMDLLRRSAAGELSEMFGAIALDKDKSIRVHRLRTRVEQNLQTVAGERMPVLSAYTEGVNAGLAHLASRPWPYLLLGVQPKAWLPVDSVLAGYAMFFELQNDANSRELALWKIRQAVPDALYQIINSDGTEWDAPLLGPARGNVALPDAELLDLRKLPVPADDAGSDHAEPAAPGSNNFAVAGALTRDHRAIVANDMHLTLRAPNIWFRARLLYDDAAAPAGSVDV
ncbi:MAG: penicillin acylase family protein, partial [Steroidobacteraceae bacterium]